MGPMDVGDLRVIHSYVDWFMYASVIVTLVVTVFFASRSRLKFQHEVRVTMEEMRTVADALVAALDTLKDGKNHNDN